jgi:MoxR-like ATPase
MKLPAATEALGVAVAARVPVLLWGAPGTGKTATIRAVAQAMGWPCETVIASMHSPKWKASCARPVWPGSCG